MGFKPVPTRVDYVELEHEIQALWDERGVPARYLTRNAHADKRWSFIDGPITANNPMGVHHAWGRSYKDLYQRFKTMQGYVQRYQNGFDCQGLWIEVEVEKEMGFTSKRDIERFGVAEFVQACKDRVVRFADQITEQSKRLGYWMDWEHSYFTNSDENNYTIWAFLKKCWQNGWIYKGKDTMPWCPRCGTGISQHEIVTEGYQELTHASVFLKFPLNERPGESLLVWTTTPWTLAANVAAAVQPDLAYLRVKQGDEVLHVSKGALASAIEGPHELLGEVLGSELVGLTYRGPFDELPAQEGVRHPVIAWEEVSDAEGTGIVHIAPGAGTDDFQLGKEHDLTVIAPLDEDGTYLEDAGFGFLEGKTTFEVPPLVFESLREKGLLYRVEDYTHRYPVCWRCGTELVFRLVDEWFISMDELRFQIMEVTQKARWVPEFGLARELDWLRNMHDWMISKKRYYGLALPIYDCAACGHFEVVGSEDELRERAIEGWSSFEGHSPHRPFVDAVKIACASCGAPVERIKDVGNPWLDAGIVPYSTLNYRHDREYWRKWFPADWVSESFPGQFRNWFYSLLAMSTVMENQEPFKSLFSYALLRDEQGEEMHKSKGNAIWFDDAAERMGADVMRWMFFRHPPANNLNFGWHGGDELKRGFLSTLWNTYSFFVTYANIDGWSPLGQGEVPVAARPELDRWALSELQILVREVTDALESYDAMTACRQIEAFVDDLSNWYVRRSRRRFWKAQGDTDKRAAYETLWTCLTTVDRLLAPFLPFLAEELHQNLVVRWTDDAVAQSVHLADWPQAREDLIDDDLAARVRVIKFLASLGRSARAKSGIKVRQPLSKVFVITTPEEAEYAKPLLDELLEELNVKDIEFVTADREVDFVDYRLLPKLDVLGPKFGKDLARIRQEIDKLNPLDVVRGIRFGFPVALPDGLSFDDLILRKTDKPGHISAEDGGRVMVVNTEVTPALADEGMARELVRHVQELRKRAGLEIADHIRLTVGDDADLARVLRDWGDYIRQETLAVAATTGAPPAAAHVDEQEIEGHRVTLAIERA